MSLHPSDFAEFWRRVHGRGDDEAPFPWQQRLVDQICATGKWPDVIDVPTGLGKTTTLDVAVFTLALSLTGAISVKLPRRTFLVIDRRVVVDQSFDHAQRIASALAQADADHASDVVGQVARALRPLPIARHDARSAGTDDRDIPLVVGRMRGGVTWSWRWLERPDQPAVVIGTIDQLGSRLLFNGYGLGQTLQPIDAALTGSDALVLVDEAHLAEPFLRTLTDAQAMATPSEPLPVPPCQVVVMSATANPDADAVRFSASNDTEAIDPRALNRLLAPKQLVTVEVTTTKARRADQMAQALATAAFALSGQHEVVGVVANTVDVARASFDLLRGRPDIADEQVLLVTGRQRRVDREPLWHQWEPLIAVGRPVPDRPLFVVATQTIEVGADLDFSALVTESCALDALTQRLGRLNRTGRWPDARAVVVHPAGLDADPIYGEARLATWHWLCDHVPAQPLSREGVLDWATALSVAPSHLRELTSADADTSRLLMPRPEVPVLFPGVLDRWVRTWPRAIDTPLVAPFLHGFARDLPTVSVLWRWARPNVVSAEADLIASLQLLPPSPDELIELPLATARAWLFGETPAEATGDTLSVADPQAIDATKASASRTSTARQHDTVAVVVPNDGSTPRRLANRLAPNAVIAVPTWVGGLDQFGWAPGSIKHVIDVADLAVHRLPQAGAPTGRRAVLRLGTGTLAAMGVERDWLAPHLDTILQAHANEEPWQPLAKVLADALASHVPATPAGQQLGDLLGALVAADKVRTTWVGGDVSGDDVGDETASGTLVLLDASASLDTWANDSTSTGTSLSRERVLLDAHGEAVAARAQAFAEALGLPAALTEAVRLAARWHDLGKHDPRFQRMLTGGFPPPLPLAKSRSKDFVGAFAYERARRAAGYPAGMRHEAFSSRAVGEMLADHPERELIVHLVASHHGRARPLEGVVSDESPIAYSVSAVPPAGVELRTDVGADWSQPSRFAALNARFGPWGLALLETIVRLADIGCSSEGS